MKTLQEIACFQIFENLKNIISLVGKHKYLFCSCDYEFCYSCLISNECFSKFKENVFKFGFKYLVNEYKSILKLKNELISRVGYRKIFFNDITEYNFFKQ